MKYVASMAYANGSIIGATVEANSSEEAWRKLLRVVSSPSIEIHTTGRSFTTGI